MVIALRHGTLTIGGVQFPPESVLTVHGLAMRKNVVGEVTGKK